MPALRAPGQQAEKASNTIQPEARASIDFRLVPDETPASVKPLVERHIAAQGSTIVRDAPDAATRARNPKIVASTGARAIRPPARRSISRSRANSSNS